MKEEVEQFRNVREERSANTAPWNILMRPNVGKFQVSGFAFTVDSKCKWINFSPGRGAIVPGFHCCLREDNPYESMRCIFYPAIASTTCRSSCFEETLFLLLRKQYG